MTQKCATLIINALPGTTAEKITNDAKEGEYKVDIIQCSSGKYHYFGSIKG